MTLPAREPECQTNRLNKKKLLVKVVGACKSEHQACRQYHLP
jgi:hypothetical protein